MEIQTIIILVLAILLLVVLGLFIKSRYHNKNELPCPIEADVLVIKHTKVPSEDDTVFFENKIVYAKKKFGGYDNFFFKEIYWLLSPEGDLIKHNFKTTNISRENCVFALTPCSLGDILVRGTKNSQKQSFFSVYRLLHITDSELVFIKTEFEPKYLFIMKYLAHNKPEPLEYPKSIKCEHISF